MDIPLGEEFFPLLVYIHRASLQAINYMRNLKIKLGICVHMCLSIKFLKTSDSVRRTCITLSGIQNGARIDAVNETGCTALFHAVRQGHQTATQLLLESGANLETK